MTETLLQSPTYGFCRLQGSSLILNLRRAGGRGTPTLIVQRLDEILEWDARHLGEGTGESGQVESATRSVSVDVPTVPAIDV